MVYSNIRNLVTYVKASDYFYLSDNGNHLRKKQNKSRTFNSSTTLSIVLYLKYSDFSK